MSEPDFWEVRDFKSLIFAAPRVPYLLWLVLLTANIRFSAVWRPCAPEGNLASDERRSLMSIPLSQKPLRPEPI